MVTRLITSLPLGQADSLFVRVLAWASPRVSGHACVPDCGAPRTCGSCSCGGACLGEKYCDDCTGAFCDCYCPPPPIC